MRVDTYFKDTIVAMQFKSTELKANKILEIYVFLIVKALTY